MYREMNIEIGEGEREPFLWAWSEEGRWDTRAESPKITGRMNCS